jgi:hypothetical protein
MVLWFNNYCSSNKQTCFLIILLCFGDGICSSYVWILNTRDMQQPVVVDAAASCPTLLSSPLLFSYFYVWQQLLLFVLPMMKLSKARAAAAFFQLSPLLSFVLSMMKLSKFIH